MGNRLFRIFMVLSIFVAALPVHEPYAADSEPDQAGLRVLSSNERQVHLILKTPSYKIVTAGDTSRGAVTLQVPGIPNDNTPGELRLPRLSRLVAIPPGVDVQLAYHTAASQVVPGRYRLLLAGEPQPLVEELTPGIYRPDSPIDNSLSVTGARVTPAEPVRISDEVWLRDQRMVRVDFFPFQYDISTSSLRWHPTIEVTLNFTRVTGADPLALSSDEKTFGPLDSLAEGLVINPQNARQWRNTDWQSTSAIPLARSASTADFDETRYKITVNEDGLYEVTGAELEAVGLDLSQVNPQDFNLSTQGLPAAFRVQDIDGDDGEADGVFDPSDRIVFYGERFRGDRMAARYESEDDLWAPMPTGWQPHMTAEMFEKYTDQNVYWLDVNGPAGLRMGAVNGFPTGSNPIFSQLNTTAHAEEDNRWYSVHRSGEDTWFWERIAAISPITPTVRTYLLELPGIAASSAPAVLSGELLSDIENISVNPDHHIELSINGNSIFVGEWDGTGRYPFSVEFDQALLLEGSNQLTLAASLISGGSSDQLYINWFELTYSRQLQAQSDQLFFEYDELGSTWQYRVGGFTSAEINVLDISTPLDPIIVQVQPGTLQNGFYEIEFQAQHPQTAHYLVTAGPPKSPFEVSAYAFKNLHASTQGADYLIIAPTQFAAAAQTLADYRAAQGLRSRVVDLEDIINEFNDGIYHSLAIKSFLAYTLANWVTPAPAYVVLVGSGHWNFFYRPGPTNNYSDAPIYMPPHLVWVDPWQGEVDSATALAAVVGNDLLPDLAIGRIPVNTPEELTAVINKIITYETDQGQIKPDHFLFIADNQPDLAGNFMNISEDVIESTVPDFQTIDRVYLNDFSLTEICIDGVYPVLPSPCPQATQSITNYVNNKELDFVNYTGHAARNYWADELLLRTTSRSGGADDLELLNNSTNLPILLSMTCLDGYWIYPSLDFPSLAVNLLRKAGGGVVAAYSPTGLGLAHGHDVLNKAFYNSLYSQGVKELGAAAMYSKLKLFETGQNFDLIYTYTIFGDPALRLNTTPGSIFIPVLPNQASP